MERSTTELNRKAFSRPAGAFGDARDNGVLTSDSDWVFAQIPRTRRDLVLDVAAGTGLGGRAIAPEVRQVIALDATEAMLHQGRAEAARDGIENIVFMRGDAAALPFIDGSFRTVLCREAMHHFPDPTAQLAEMRRVLEPRGWLGLADMVVPEQADAAALANRIERLRDRSHARALSASELQDTLVRAGFEVAGAETREIRRPLEPWLEQAGTPAPEAAEIRQILEAELDGTGAVSGLSPRREFDRSISCVHTLTSLLALNVNA